MEKQFERMMIEQMKGRLLEGKHKPLRHHVSAVAQAAAAASLRFQQMEIFYINRAQDSVHEKKDTAAVILRVFVF